MSNSVLSTYKNFSPNRTKGRKQKITGVAIHCAAGVINQTAQSIVDYLARPTVQASANYAVGGDGSIAQGVLEENTAWTTSNPDVDSQCITIEVASDSAHPQNVNKVAIDSLVILLVDVCKRNNIRLKYGATPEAGGNIYQHCWYKNKSCPGATIQSLLPQIAERVNNLLDNKETIDKPKVMWYDKAMGYCKDKGYMLDGKPEDLITRAEVAQIIYNIERGV